MDATKLLPLLRYAFSIPYFKGERTDGKLGNSNEDARDDLESECRLFKNLMLRHYDTLDEDESLFLLRKCFSSLRVGLLSESYGFYTV